MFDFHLYNSNDVFIHFTAAIYVISYAAPVLCIESHLTEPFCNVPAAHTYLVLLTFLTIPQLFTFVTCRRSLRRLRTALIRSLISGQCFSFACVVFWFVLATIFENIHP